MKPVKTIQVITDITDASYNEIFACMHGIAKHLTTRHVEFAPLTPVKEFSILHGAFLTRLLAQSCISPTVIFTNVSPHQTFKSDIIGKIKGKDIIFIGSNNGTFDWLVKDYGVEYVGEITVKKPFVVDGKLVYLPGKKPPADYETRFNHKTDNFTFAAHTTWGAIAVALAVGIDYQKFAEKKSEDTIVPLPIKNGQVVHIDNYGNTKIFGSLPFAPGTKLALSVQKKKKATALFIDDRMMSYPTNSFVVYPSTSLPHMVDLALVRGNASKKLGFSIGDVITFRTL